MQLCRTALILLITCSIHAQATAPGIFRDEVVVTASAIPERVQDVPASVTVISRDEIEAKHAIDLEEVLREVPGLFLSRSGSSGHQSSLFTRGVNSSQTLVLWNGIEINNPYFSGYDWGQFSTVGVEKIEVARGPFSSLYGADAVGGVVHIITGANRSGISTDLQAGERSLLNGRAEVTMVGSETSADIAVEGRTDDGFHSNDDFEQASVLASAHWSRGERLFIGISGRFNDYDLGIPFDLGLPSPNRRQRGGELQAALPVTGSFGGSVLNLTVSRTEHRIDFEDPSGAFGPIVTETDSEIDRAAGSVRFDTFFGVIVAGGELEDAEVRDESLFGTNLDHRRKSRSLYLEDRYSRSLPLGELEIAAGFRYDDYERFGSESSPRFSAGWRLGTVRARVGYGEAFRAPSIGDLYYPFYGNPELGAETSRSVEAGVDWYGAKGKVSATWFHNDIDDLIVFDPTTSRAENIGEAQTSGVELSGSFRGGPVRVYGAWTFLDAEDRLTGEDLLRRPSGSGSLSAVWERGRFGVGATTTYAGRRKDFQPSFPFGVVTNDSYTTVDLDLTYRAGNGLMPYLQVDNLLDETYQEVLGYPSPTRRLTAGLRYSR